MDFKFETNMQQLKYSVLKEAATIGFNQSIHIDKDKIAEKIIPGRKPTFRCCTDKERNIIKERISYALCERETTEIVQVIERACDQCPIDRYTVTSSCRGCIARSCSNACPVNAVFFCEGKAYIDQAKCIECGRCKEACQFNAISDVMRPCRRSCPVDAINMDEDKVATIDYEKCISCGNCAYNCPFGAITDVSSITDVARNLSNSSKIFALIAPSISSQFDDTTIGQVKRALKEIGFTDVIEVALGADMVIKMETEEFKEHIENNSYMTTSCCPGFYNLIETQFPEELPNVSTTVSPMIALGRYVKSLHSESKTVFIGPCIAKKSEAKRENLEDAIDYVITFEELRALIGAKNININTLDVDPLDNASYFGRMFAISSGVSGSIKEYISQNNIDVEYNPIAANGIKDCIKNLKLAKHGKLPHNFIEGMACSGGCIGGPGSLTHRRKDIQSIKKYASLAKEKNVDDSLQVHDLKNINMHR